MSTTYRPEVTTLAEGAVIRVQGHPAIARDVRVNAERTDAQRITFRAEFLPHPDNRLVMHTAYNGGTYSLCSLNVLSAEQAARVLVGQ